MSDLFGKDRFKLTDFLETVTARPNLDDVQSVVRATPVGAAVSAINAVFIFFLCVEAANVAFLTPWLGCTLALSAILHRRSHRARSASLTRVSARANRRLIAFTGACALPWSALAFYVIGFGGAGDGLVILLVCAGMSTGGLFMLHRALAASVCFYSTILFSIIVSVHLGGHPSAWPITVCSITYGVFLTVFAFVTGQTARERDGFVDALSEVVLDLKNARDDNHRLANLDTVTELPNRTSFNEKLMAEVAKTQKTGQPFTLLCLDLDHFKNVNDVYGHAIGDKLLNLVGLRLRYAVKATDCVARLGGDEFAIILKGIDTPDKINAAVDRLISAVTRPADVDGISLHPVTSIGAASCPLHAVDKDALMSKADLALNKAKEGGRARTIVFDESLRDLMVANDRIEVALRAAIENHDIQVTYQPKFHLHDGTLAGAEALARWTDADLGAIAPDRFLSIASERGLLPILTRYIASQVAADILFWRDAGVAIGKIALNIHPSDLKSPDALLETVDHLKAQGVTHRDLTLEITEGCFVGRGTDRALHVLDLLADRGFELSLDDFGTGHASLSHLKKLPVSEIKIDRSFVKGIAENTNDRAIVAAIAEIARGMELRSVAEGVEDSAQRDILDDLGIGIGQGFLWSAAVSADHLLATVMPKSGTERKIS